ncbi:hypothetical protein C5B85_18200 [Pseudoclavibacter sp. AY1F1]|uniref:hypothetical protein n=1 Tax=Pseudoclavibacter sp. AY1F1 TaxID=2080583 RepID=UPI000CE8BE4A|nr:hypothetical protein [Pseudoclavibacter sp. AY1F1]PPF41853.1 hypothetical protein C5B85_18200 [Pseudoclavibacter sp. AY1F1]
MSGVILTMPGIPFTPEDVQVAHDDVVRIVRTTDWPSENLNAMPSYPLGWCSAMSYAVGRLLRRRGLGVWRIAANGHHDWLEYVDAGDVIYSVDATQHQFPGHEAAWLGLGSPPIADLYPAHDWAVCGGEPRSWAKWPSQVLDAVVTRRLR